MLRLKVIACKALYREISLISATSENFIDVTYLQQGLHDTPSLLNKAIQTEIDAIDAQTDIHTFKHRPYRPEFDAIVLGYGLCSNAVLGLTSKRYQIVIPRCDDCISLFLGSYEKYKTEFNKESGTYWYNASWIESSAVPSKPCREAVFHEYSDKFGEENARFLIESEYMVNNYSRAAYVYWDEINFPKYVDYTKDAAKFVGLRFEAIKGDKSYIEKMIGGDWNEKDFLTVPVGKTVAADYTGKIMITE